MPIVPRQRRHSSPIHAAAAPVAMKPVTIAGDAIKPSDMEKPEIELARPRNRWSARLLSNEPMVGEKKVSPRPKRAVKARTQATLAAGGVGSADSPKTAQDAAQITATGVIATLRRSRRKSRSTSSCVATINAVLMVTESATTRTETCATTVENAGRPESNAG